VPERPDLGEPTGPLPAALGIDDALVWSISKSAVSVDRIGEARRIHLGRAGLLGGSAEGSSAASATMGG
jgi:hypothetical protein